MVLYGYDASVYNAGESKFLETLPRWLLGSLLGSKTSYKT
jgi:hypothetical protein